MILRSLLELFCGRYVRLDGPFVPFEDPGAASTPAPVPPAGPASASGPAAAAFSPKPGAGRRANECVIGDADHQCEDWHGNATNRMCRQSSYRRSADNFDARHPNFFGDGPGTRRPMTCCGGFPGEHFETCPKKEAMA